MGQILQADTIGALSHSSGVITLQASRLTIGGQQYTTSVLNRTIATDVTMTATTMYMIYAVVSGGVVSLRVSANVNSVGPAGFTAWKLVGAFLTSISSAFGAFLNIEGVPQCEEIDNGVLTIGALTTPPTKGTTGRDKMWTKREGIWLMTRYEYRQTGAGTAGSGSYTFTIPIGTLSIDTNKLYTAASTGSHGITLGSGDGTLNNAGDAVRVDPIYYDTNRFRMIGDSGPTDFFVDNANMHLGGTPEFYFTAKVPIIGWSNTPLKDL